jgi:hypothetical protein
MKNLRPEVKECLKSHQAGMHGVTDLLDDIYLTFYNLTDEEFDFMLEHATDEEMSIIANAALGNGERAASFSLRRQALILRNSYLEKFGTLK